MRTKHLKRWLWLLIAISWGCLYAVLTFGLRENLTGWLPQMHRIFAVVQGTLVGGAAFCLLNLRWQVVGWLLVSLAIFFAFPIPSMAGLNLRIENRSSIEKHLSVSRTDQPNRRVEFSLSPHADFKYRTAPGDWSSSVGLNFQSGTNNVVATIFELRRKRVVLMLDTVCFEDIAAGGAQVATNSILP